MTGGRGVRYVPPTLTHDEPYPGLKAFGEADRQYFFGRELESRELFRRVRRSPATVFFGASGLGKTSLIHAGLFPLLRTERFFPVSVRLDFGSSSGSLVSQIRGRIAEEIAGRGVDGPLPEDRDTLWEYCHRSLLWTPRNHLLTPVLVLDQFEELFTLGSGHPEVPTLITELGDLIENRIPASVRVRMDAGEDLGFVYDKLRFRIVVALREDYLPHLEGLVGTIPALVENRLRLLKMSGDRALQAVREPAEGIVTSAVAEEIVRTAAGESDEDGALQADAPLKTLEVEPALLSLICRELNAARRARGHQRITTELLSVERGRIVTDFYERSLADLDPAVRVFVEERLITKSGYRTAEATEEALATPGLSAVDLAALIDRRLIRQEPRLGIAHVELIHDVLVPVVRESRDTRRQREAFARRRRRILLGLFASIVLAGASAVFFVQSLQISTQAQRIRADGIMRRAQSVDDPMVAALLLKEVAEEGDALDPFGAVRVARAVVGAYPPLAILGPMGGEVRDARFSPDGRSIATASFDGLVRVWRADGVGEPWVLAGHQGWIRSVRFSHDGAWIATASQDSTARLWPTGAGEPRVLRGHGSIVLSAEFSPDDRYLATTSSDGTARIWDLSTDSVVTRLIHRGASVPWVWSVDFSRDGMRVVTASVDPRFSARIHFLGRSGSRPLSDSAGLHHAVFDPSGTRVATAGLDGRVRIWPVEAPGEPRTMSFKHDREVFQVSFDPSGRRVVSASYDGLAAIHWPDDPDSSLVFEGHAKDTVWSARFDPEGRRVLTASSDQTGRVWNTDLSGDPVVLTGHSDRVRNAVWSPSGDRLVTVSGDGTARLWNALPEPVLTGSGGKLAGGRFSPDGGRVITGSYDGSAWIWTLDGSSAPIRLDHGDDPVVAVDFGPDSARVLTATRSEVRIWRADGSGTPVVLEGGTDIKRAVLSPDGAWVLAEGWSGQAWLWPSGGGVGVMLDSVHSPVFSQDASRIVAGYGDRMIRVFELNGTPAATIDGFFRNVVVADTLPDGTVLVRVGEDGSQGGHRDEVFEVASSDQGRVLSVSRDGTARVWETGEVRDPLVVVEGGDPIHYVSESGADTVRGWPGHRDWVSHAIFDPSGHRVATAAADGSVLIWDLEDPGSPLALDGHVSVRALTFDRTGSRLATIDRSGQVRVWDARTGDDPVVLEANEGPATQIAFSPDGRRLLTVHERVARVWWVSWSGLHEHVLDKVQGCLTVNQRINYLQEDDGEAADMVASCRRRLGRGG